MERFGESNEMAGPAVFLLSSDACKLSRVFCLRCTCFFPTENVCSSSYSYSSLRLAPLLWDRDSLCNWRDHRGCGRSNRAPVTPNNELQAYVAFEGLELSSLQHACVYVSCCYLQLVVHIYCTDRHQ